MRFDLDKVVVDQAEGLRRLLCKNGSRVVAVTGGSGRAGRTSTVVNLAAALAAQGQDVLVIDECLGGNSVSAVLGSVRGVGSVSAVMNGAIRLDALARHSLGFMLLAAPPQSCQGYSAGQLSALLNGPAQIVLIDAQLDRRGALSALAAQAHDVLIVTRVLAQAITEAYACMKRLHYTHAIAQFRVLLNHVSSAAAAQMALKNLAQVAGHYLAVQIADAGMVRSDPQMARSFALSRCAVDAFPSSLAACDYRRLAATMPHWPLRLAPEVSSAAPLPSGLPPPRHAGASVRPA
jgi:flagellar biosynthesis protein FlhG